MRIVYKGEPNSYPGLSFKVVPENGFEVFRRVFVDFEGISLRRKFLNGLEPENIHMMIGRTWALVVGEAGCVTEVLKSSVTKWAFS